MAFLNIESVDKERRDAIDRFFEANNDLDERLPTFEVSTVLDLEDDLLAITFGKHQEALTLDTDGSLCVRVDPDTYKIVGMEIWHAHQRLSEVGPVSRIMAWALTAAGPRLKVIGPTGTSSTNVVEDMRKLVSA